MPTIATTLVKALAMVGALALAHITQDKMFFDESKLKKTITITLTQTCNLNCVYCYEHHKSKRYMPVSLAFKIIDTEMAKTKAGDEVEIDLFGGEPFVKFESIKTIVEYVEKQYPNRKVIIFITTNGTLINDEVKAFCQEHRKTLILGLSYDGTPEMQNMNRSNSADRIDLDFFRTLYPEQPVKMTISQNSLKTLADGVIYLHSHGFEIACNLAFGIDWSDSNNVGILNDQLMKLIDYYLAHPDIKPCSMLDGSISQVAFAEKIALRTCGAGWRMVSYDIDGKAYPCQFFMPLAIGKEKADKVKNIKFCDDFIPDDILDPKCVDCILKSVCPRCYGSNYMSTGNIYIQEENMCKLTKIIFKARAYFKAKLIEKGMYKDCPEEELATLIKSILLIDRKL